MNFNEGEIIPVNKPYRMSSFGALAHVRFLISKKAGVKRVKTGHAGTLDPLATGVLILCTGKATKRIEELQAHTKEYVATMKLGATTASYDREHTVNFTFPTRHITRQLVGIAVLGAIVVQRVFRDVKRLTGRVYKSRPRHVASREVVVAHLSVDCRAWCNTVERLYETTSL